MLKSLILTEDGDIKNCDENVNIMQRELKVCNIAEFKVIAQKGLLSEQFLSNTNVLYAVAQNPDIKLIEHIIKDELVRAYSNYAFIFNMLSQKRAIIYGKSNVINFLSSLAVSQGSEERARLIVSGSPKAGCIGAANIEGVRPSV